jgi:hypothetical protein
MGGMLSKSGETTATFQNNFRNYILFETVTSTVAHNISY